METNPDSISPDSISNVESPSCHGRAIEKSVRPSAAENQRFGDWQLAELLSVGELTATYTAHPVAAQPACHYVMKTTADQTHPPELAIELLRRELLVSQQVSHPHIVPVLDAQLRKPPFYLVTPRLPGTTLRTLIDRHGRLDLTTALWFARQTAQGLGALHSHHWLHADVKPENIFIAPDGHVTLIDLGFARHFQEAGTACNRRIQGTFNYIAPEMITSAYGATAGSDLYSLGATFYEMLAGQPPFQSRNLADLARAHRQQRPVCIRQLVPQISAAVADLLMGMLAKQPVRRASSTAAVVEQLVRLEIDSFARCA